MRDWPPITVAKYRSAVFLDRDGTINLDTDYPHRVEDLVFIPRSLEALQRLGKLPVHVIVIANQAGIAKGLYEKADMSRFNEALRLRAEQAGGRIDAFYYCPHPEPKDLPPGSHSCKCTKPHPGMLLEAWEDFHIDLGASFMIGDKTSDILAGKWAGCVTVLVKTGKGGREEGSLPVRPRYVAADLLAAVEIVEEHVGASAALT